MDSVPTSANQEDHISMGFAAARKLVRSVECFQYVVTVELAAAAQGLEYRRPLRAGVGVEGAHAAVREALSPLEGDRSLSAELERIRDLVDQGRFREDVIDPHFRAEP